jgi:hypothetical protein
MTNLLARILLSIMVLPLGVMCFATTAIVLLRQMPGDSAIVVAMTATVVLVAAYWLWLWRKSVVWTPSRVSRTIAGTIGCLVAGAVLGAVIMTVPRMNEATFAVFFGGVFAIVLWLPVTVLLWRETAAERAERIGQSAGDVVFCPRCGYNMTGLYEPRCPECGSRFTLNQLYAAQQHHEIGDASTVMEETGTEDATA